MIDPSSRARRKPAEERRTDLLDAGLELFAEKGFARTAVSEIARRAGVAQGTFYLHFPSKEALLVALQDRFKERISVRAAMAVEAAAPDMFAKLDALVLACFEDYERELHQHDVLFAHVSADAATHHDDPPHDGGLTATIAELLTDGNDAGIFHVADVEVTAVLLFSALHGGFDEIVHFARPLASRRIVVALQSLFRRAAQGGCGQ